MAISSAELAIVLKARDEASDTLKRSAVNLAAVGAAAAALTGILSDAARAAAAEEANIAKLSVALQNAGFDYGQMGEAIEAKIAAQQRSFAFGDSQQRDSLSALVVVTKDVNEAFKLQATAMDLARAKGISLQSATDILTKVYAGNMGALSRYGIIVEKGATATEALAAVQAQVTGQAAAFGDSSAGAIEKVRLAVGDMQEALGGMLGGLTPVFALLPGLTMQFTAMGGAAGVAAAMLNLKAAAWRVLNLVMGLSPLGILLKVVIALGTAVFVAYQKSEDFRRVVDGLFDAAGRLLGVLGSLVGGPLKWIAEQLGFTATAADAAALAIEGIGPATAKAVSEAQDAMSGWEAAKGAEDLAKKVITNLRIDPNSPEAIQIKAGLLDLVGRSADEVERILADRQLAAEDTAIYNFLVGGADKALAEAEAAFDKLPSLANRARLAEVRVERERLAAVAAHVRANIDAALKAKTASQIAVDAIDDQRHAWDEATISAHEYGRVVSQLGYAVATIPTSVRQAGPLDNPAVQGGLRGLGAVPFLPPFLTGALGGLLRSQGGPITVNAPITITDAHDRAGAQRAAGVVLDAVTSGLERQLRRSGIQ